MKAQPYAIQHRLKMPRKAILLAAGFGTRMEPLSWDLPKPMMPLCGVPLLEHALLSLEAWGVQEVLINLHHAPQEILSWFRAQKPRGTPRIVFSYEPDILGTGGALRRAAFFVGQDPCWLVNTDIAFVLDPVPLVRQFRQKQPPAVLWLDARRGPRTVACNKQGVIEDFAVQHPGRPGTYTYCGIQIFHPRLLDALPRKPFSSVIEACRSLGAQGRPVHGCCSPGSYWADLGTPARYLQAHGEVPAVLRERAAGGTFGSSGGCGMGSVLWEGSRIAAGGSVVRSIVGRGVQVHVPVQDSCVVRADLPGIDPYVRETLQALRMSPAHTLYIQLPRRGSDRSFVRLAGKRRSVILIRSRSDQRPENARYAGHARFLLEQGIRVPRVLREDVSRGTLVLEDAGQEALQDVPADRRAVWCRRVMRMVARLHAIPLGTCPPLERGFDADLLAWEHNLFAEHFLAKYDTLLGRCTGDIARELEEVARRLTHEPRVLLHRDLQSSNILLHRDKPVIIDFQGMRAGPAVYDLASLLYDPYVALSPSERADYLSVYLRGVDMEAADRIRAMLPWGGIQRLVQALGAFGRLSAQPGTDRFAAYIPVACETLQMLLAQTNTCPTLARVLSRCRVRPDVPQMAG